MNIHQLNGREAIKGLSRWMTIWKKNIPKLFFNLLCLSTCFTGIVKFRGYLCKSVLYAMLNQSYLYFSSQSVPNDLILCNCVNFREEKSPFRNKDLFTLKKKNDILQPKSSLWTLIWSSLLELYEVPRFVSAFDDAFWSLLRCRSRSRSYTMKVKVKKYISTSIPLGSL